MVHCLEGILAIMQTKRTGSDGTYHSRLLAAPDLRDLQRLFDRCADYFELATGAPAGPDEATRAYVAGPPTKSVDDKRVIGVYDQHAEMVGVLDALVDWPEDRVWTMGMLLLAPEHRGRGLGSWLLEAYEEWARSHGAQRYRTALVSHHDRGIRFLERRGYVRDGTIRGYNAGTRQATIDFLAKSAIERV
jgi:GNAT superfamily N-acetyltransferase